MHVREPCWTLAELTAQVAQALGLDGPRQASGRVRDVPDQRAIRYYHTLGLVDPPAGFRGRTALYSVRHLWQLVAIKRLQARGLSLAEVQQRLLGLPDDELRRLADVPEPGAAPHPGKPIEAEDESAFWKAEPASPVPRQDTARTLTSIPLAPGVTLLVEDLTTLDEHDLAALRGAAAPILRLLAQRRLNTNSTEDSA